MKLPVNGKLGNLFETKVDYIAGRAQHEAIDIIVGKSEPILAIADGTITKIIDKYDEDNSFTGFGNEVLIRYENGAVDRFCHLAKEIKVKVDQKIKEGETIGYVGRTGYRYPISIYHTHWERYVNDKRVDPLTNNIPNNEELTLEDMEQLKELEDKIVVIEENIKKIETNIEKINELTEVERQMFLNRKSIKNQVKKHLPKVWKIWKK